MINTGKSDLKESLEIGKKMKVEVNKLYKCLEIEIDGVFKSLLLLKKKKYAALAYADPFAPNPVAKKEVKGLDMVRRDWCGLSKTIGNTVLDMILAGMSKDDLVLKIDEYVSEMGRKISNGDIPLSEYIITKQLTRAPSDYSDPRGLPHVIIAKRMQKEEGKNDQELINTFVPYVITANPDEP